MPPIMMGTVRVNAADQVTVHHRGMIRTLSGLPRAYKHRSACVFWIQIMIHHGIHISGRNKKSAAPWASKTSMLFILPVGLDIMYTP